MKKRAFGLLILVIFLFVFINLNFVSAEYFRVKCSSGIGSPSIRFGYVDGATEGADGNYDALYPPSPVTPRIDFYLQNSGNDYMVDARGGDSISDFYARIDGVSITGTVNADLSFSLYDNGQGNFEGKDFNVELYNASDYTNPNNLIASYDIYDLINGYNSFPELNITTGLSYQLVIDASLVPETEISSGGGGGIEEKLASIKNLVITQKILNIPIIINKVKTEKIELYNNGSSVINVSIGVEGLEDILIIKKKDRSFKLNAGERKEIEIKIAAPSAPGIYTGKLIINGQEVLITLNVNTKELLFDAKIIIPDELKIINKGDKLKTKITLIPLGEAGLDVTLKYIISDFSGKNFLTESETIKVNENLTFTKEFATNNLPTGDYIFGLEVLYEKNVATTSANFKVIEKGLLTLSGNSILLILGIAIIILILLILIRYKSIKHRNIKKHKRHKR
jgi:hypothetical protein